MYKEAQNIKKIQKDWKNDVRKTIPPLIKIVSFLPQSIQTSYEFMIFLEAPVLQWMYSFFIVE